MIKPFEHFWIKLTAVILGFLLWIHVATEKTYNYHLHLPVTRIDLESGLTLISKPVDSLQIVVTATGKQLMRQKWRERGLRIVANDLKPGRHQIQLNTSNVFLAITESHLSLDEVITPTSAVLAVDSLIETRVAVEPSIITEPDDGFAVASVSQPRPAQVTLIGPKSLVSKIPLIYTQQKELRGLRNDIRMTLPIDRPVGFDIRVEPDTVEVTVEVVPVKTRVFENIPVVIFNPPTDSQVIADPPTVRVEITGSPAEIDLLNRNAVVASVDYTARNNQGRAKLKLDVPSKFKVKHSSADSVTFRIM